MGDGFHDGQTLAASFAHLALALERLQPQAPVAEAAQLLALLPSGSGAGQRLILCELIKCDLAAAARQVLDRDLDYYWPFAQPILPREEVPVELVLECVKLRQQAGLAVDWQRYSRLFPAAAETISKQALGTQVFTQPQPATGLPTEFALGSQVDDFTILKPLGQGSFARVYLARQESMSRLVALKVSSRRSNESRALSQLDHPNIVRVFDQRTLPSPAVNLLYMQYIPGGTLANVIEHLRSVPCREWNGSLLLKCIDQSLLGASQTSPEQSVARAQIAALEWSQVVAWIGLQIAEGLQYSNQRGVLHRDVKPANILLTSEGIPKLVDFNVSSSATSGGEAESEADFGGSLGYMSPEQLGVADPTERRSPGTLDIRSDLYGLGLVLWELWQGERPWRAEHQPTMEQAIVEQRRIRQLPCAIQHPPQSSSARILLQVLASLLQHQPERRPESGQEVAARLKLALQPELAYRFEPPPRSLAGRLRRIPMLLMAAVVIFVPNTAASIFNYYYNWLRMAELRPRIPQIEEDFTWIANWVNGIVFPVGAILFLGLMLPLQRLLQYARRGERPASAPQLSQLWSIGLRATLICAVLWSISGIVFAGFFASLYPGEFRWPDAFHFFISLVLCGGVAAIYPYFGMSLLALLIYYPQVIAKAMVDEQFDARRRALERTSAVYLLLAAAIPLSAVALLVFRQNLPRGYILAGTAVTLLGLLASFYAQRRLEIVLQQYQAIFSRCGKNA